MTLPRRHFLLGAALLAASAPARALAQASTNAVALSAAELGVVAGAGDQTDALQQALETAAGAGLPLFIPGGAYTVGTIELPSATTILGVRGATILRARGAEPIFAAAGQQAIVLRDLLLDGAGSGGSADRPGLIALSACDDIEFDGLELLGSAANGLYLERTSGRVENLRISNIADTGIFALDSAGLSIIGNRIATCGNGGIRVWASEPGYDGTLIAGNDISDIRSDGGGNGQNGNGINVFRAGGVTVSGNRLRACAFSAIRLNTTNDTIVSANTCLDSGEVAIFSEFAFAGSVIADNIVDGAAQGISMTNFSENGRLVTCTGNIVRNIAPFSRVNPDTSPVGIFAEADAVIADNVVESVPGLGIGAGWGPYLRDVSITGNVVRDVDIGIGVSVADGAGPALVASNLVSGARRAAIAGLAWTDIVTDDLARDAAQFPHVTVDRNRVG
jgi:uncharacterized secreted repeat protein (TIGR03808 family)